MDANLLPLFVTLDLFSPLFFVLILSLFLTSYRCIQVTQDTEVPQGILFLTGMSFFFLKIFYLSI